MPDTKQFRILTPDGLLSRDTFVVPAEQPRATKAGCLLVVEVHSGRQLTVHDTWLFPAEAAAPPAIGGATTNMCLTCGKVQGVVEDQISCPYRGETPCGLVESSGR